MGDHDRGSKTDRNKVKEFPEARQDKHAKPPEELVRILQFPDGDICNAGHPMVTQALAQKQQRVSGQSRPADMLAAATACSCRRDVNIEATTTEFGQPFIVNPAIVNLSFRQSGPSGDRHTPI